MKQSLFSKRQLFQRHKIWRNERSFVALCYAIFYLFLLVSYHLLLL